jgi:retron-type reverse transcriptase
MQEPRVYLELVRERGKKGLPLTRVYRQLFNRQGYLIAYGKIYRNKGAMTQGATPETVESMSVAKIDAIINALRQERYRWKPVRRVFIPKRNGTGDPRLRAADVVRQAFAGSPSPHPGSVL